jgi:hypothetical protein
VAGAELRKFLQVGRPPHPLFRQRAQFWLDVLSQHHIAVVEKEKGAEIKERVRPAKAA